jgi:hypothetical protein
MELGNADTDAGRRLALVRQHDALDDGRPSESRGPRSLPRRPGLALHVAGLDALLHRPEVTVSAERGVFDGRDALGVGARLPHVGRVAASEQPADERVHDGTVERVAQRDADRRRGPEGPVGGVGEEVPVDGVRTEAVGLDVGPRGRAVHARHLRIDGVLAHAHPAVGPARHARDRRAEPRFGVRHFAIELQDGARNRLPCRGVHDAAQEEGRLVRPPRERAGDLLAAFLRTGARPEREDDGRDGKRSAHGA